MKEQPGLIGVCLSTMYDADRFNIIKSLNASAVDNGYRLLIFNSCTDLYEQNNLNNAGEAAVFRLIPCEKLSALVICSNFIWDTAAVKLMIESCHEHGVPVISIDKVIEGCFSFSFTYSDCFEQLCCHVIEEHGARRLLMVAGIKGNDFSEERVRAFRNSLEKNGLPFDDSMVGYGQFWDGPTLELIRNWFEVEKRELPDAMICANDTMAITVSSYLQKQGYELPRDCIVTGFDGIMQSGYHIPHITTCQPDYDTMGRKITEAVVTLENGGEVPASTEVGFNIIHSQSCGCAPIESHNVNEAIQELIDRLKLSSARQTLMCSIQSSISKMADITELPRILIDKFAFHTNIFALNDDLILPPDFGEKHKGENAFSSKQNVLYRRYFWNICEPCTVSVKELVPDWQRLLERTDPIVVCVLHFIDTVMGYCVFQPEIDIDQYEKMHTLMSAINAALGSFHSRIQINSINTQLRSVNDELERLSVHDYLTGMLNRRGFYGRIYRQLKDRLGDDVSLAVISADLDGLKYINDTFGHLEGDNAICTVSRALRASAVRGEICARFGGDEFSAAGIIPAGTEEEYFSSFIKRFKGFLNEYNEAAGKEYEVGSSIGYCWERLTDGISLDELIKTADDRMYADKIKRKKERR